MKKEFFIIFKGLSMKQITQKFLEGESPTLTTFSNIKFSKYLPLGIFSFALYSSFLQIKPSALQNRLSISFR